MLQSFVKRILRNNTLAISKLRLEDNIKMSPTEGRGLDFRGSA
jgi:hypothetical protein